MILRSFRLINPHIFMYVPRLVDGSHTFWHRWQWDPRWVPLWDRAAAHTCHIGGMSAGISSSTPFLPSKISTCGFLQRGLYGFTPIWWPKIENALINNMFFEEPMCKARVTSLPYRSTCFTHRSPLAALRGQAFPQALAGTWGTVRCFDLAPICLT